MKNVSMIAAIGKNRELGIDNHLIWHFSEDMKFFKDNTINKNIIMGRNTFESLPHLLKNRTHLVLTSKKYDIDGIKVFNSIDEITDYINNNSNLEYMVIGGARVYQEFIDLSDSLYITVIDDSHIADAYFPVIDNNIWNRRVLSKHNHDNINYEHVLYTRKLK